LPPPPRSTLFPYTTLFRSGLSWRGQIRAATGAPTRRRCDDHPSDHCVVARENAARHVRADAHEPDHRVLDVIEGRVAAAQAEQADRKSTRLNSSHLGISYA